jgi:hypothetical protein
MGRFSARSAEIQIRDLAGHWEGDLIVGRGNQSAIGTLAMTSDLYVECFRDLGRLLVDDAGAEPGRHRPRDGELRHRGRPARLNQVSGQMPE